MRLQSRRGLLVPSRIAGKNAANSYGHGFAFNANDAMSHDDNLDVGEFLSENIIKILHYVGAHPRAKDTISGIEKWWLAANLSLEGRRRLEDELNLLVLKGWLNARGSAQSETVYSLNESKLPEINEFLRRRS